MTRLILISSACGIVAALLIILGKCVQSRPEIEGHWRESEDGVEPGEILAADPRTSELVTLLRGWQGRQVTYTRVGREWTQ